MGPLSASEIVSVWERGNGRHPVDRALVLLAAACPGADAEQLACFAIGRRDTCLLRLREGIFGPIATGAARCPHCFEALEFTIRTADLAGDGPPVAEGPLELSEDGLRVKFRLPDSADLRAIAGCQDVTAARRLLHERCVLEASRDGMEIGREALSEEALAELGSRMAECDPLADISLDLKCAACGHAWPVAFDIASFLWHEIEALAKRLLGEVHTLARAYGWSETDILALGPARRNYYLEMAG
jgi:hypothetical protein